jgi:hypothetical protein
MVKDSAPVASGDLRKIEERYWENRSPVPLRGILAAYSSHVNSGTFHHNRSAEEIAKQITIKLHEANTRMNTEGTDFLRGNDLGMCAFSCSVASGYRCKFNVQNQRSCCICSKWNWEGKLVGDIDP